MKIFVVQAAGVYHFIKTATSYVMNAGAISLQARAYLNQRYITMSIIQTIIL